jgi:WD40 repeat protein
MDDMVFEAFISYRHKEPDSAVAKAIHRQIEAYRIPAHIAKAAGKKRMGKIFRDQEELPLLADLGEGIRKALAGSEWLIVVCSPDLPKSQWCMAELDYFIELGRRNRILTVLVDGEPADSFPPQLRFRETGGEIHEVEPLAADVRAAGTGASLRRVRREKLRLLAPMLGVGYDDLRRRQRERILHRAAAISVCVTVFSLAAGAYVLRQNAIISRQRDEALISQSKFLSGISADVLAAGDPATAALLALEALPNDLENPERPLVDGAANALRNARASRVQGAYTLSGGVSTVFQSGWKYLEKDRVLTYADNGRQLFYHMPSGRFLGQTEGALEAHSPERSLVAISTVVEEKKLVAVYDLRDPSVPLQEFAGSDRIHSVSFAAGGRYLFRRLTDREAGYAEILDTDSGASLFRLTERDLFVGADMEALFHPYLDEAVVSPDCKYLAVAVGRAEADAPVLELYEIPSGRKAAAPEYALSDGSRDFWQTRGIERLSFSPDGRFLCALDGAGAAHIFLTATGARVASVAPIEPALSHSVPNIVFSPNGEWLAVWTPNSDLALYRTATGERVAQADPALGPADYAGFTGDGMLIFHRGTASDELIVLPPDAPDLRYAVTIPELHTDAVVLAGAVGNRGVAAHADGFTAYSERGTYQLWEHASPGEPAVADAETRNLGTASSPDIRVFSGAVSADDTACAYSPDGRRFAISAEGVVKVFDAGTLEELAAAEPEPDETRTRQILWLPDGERLLSVSHAGSARVLDADTGAVLHVWPSKYTVSPFAVIAAVSPDGKLFAVNSPSQIGGMYDLDTYEKLYDFPGSFKDKYGNGTLNFTCGYAFSADSRIFYAGVPSASGEPPFLLGAIEADTGEISAELPYVPEYGMAVSADGKKLAFGGRAGDDSSAASAFFVLDTATGTELWRSETEVGIRGVVAWSRDGAYVAAGDTNDGRTTVWDAAAGEIEWTLPGYDPLFSPDSRFLLLSDAPAFGRNIADGGSACVMYDTQTGTASTRFTLSGIFSPNGDAVLMQNAVWYRKSLDELMREAREHLGGREFTSAERRDFFLE